MLVRLSYSKGSQVAEIALALCSHDEIIFFDGKGRVSKQDLLVSRASIEHLSGCRYTIQARPASDGQNVMGDALYAVRAILYAHE